MVRKAVVTAGGLGTRLLPSTKETPKEMLPIFTVCTYGGLCLKPVIHIVFETLYESGFRDFCFIVGRGKRAVEDYFTPDEQFVQLLKSRGLNNHLSELIQFYNMICNSRLFFINQPEPKGFGDAVLRAEPFVGSEPFLLHAGDDIILSNNADHIRRLTDVFRKYRCDVTFFVENVEDPREYGVVKAKPINDYVLYVLDIVEKPKVPPSNLAVVAIYVFKPIIFNALRNVKPDGRGEVQLTHAIQQLLQEGRRVLAVKLYDNERRLDVGNPMRYWRALYESYDWALEKLKRVSKT